MTELHNLSLFFSALAKFLVMTGLGIGGAVALIAECCGFRIAPVKIVALGVEQVSERAISRKEKDRNATCRSNGGSTGNKPAPKVMEVAA